MRPIAYFLLSLLLFGCSYSENICEVIVYTSVDQHYSEPVFMEFEKACGIKVKAVYDVEANKTTGLVNRLISEQNKPKADVFWNGEYSQTLLLASKGLLSGYRSSQADQAVWLDDEDLWSAFGGRARVFIINQERMRGKPVPDSVFDLISHKWPADKIGLALPLFGTTATHAAALWARLGPEDAADYFRQIKTRGVQLVDGNSAVRDRVVSGELWFGLTDSDDACAAAAKGAPITIRFPDQTDGAMGTLVIPNTVALVAGGPNKANGRKMIDFLLNHQTQTLLAKLGWFHITAGKVSTEQICPLPKDVRILDVPPKQVYAQLANSRTDLRELYLR